MAKLDVEDLYNRYGHVVYRRCVAILGNEQDAMDALHNVFIKIMKYGSSYNAAKKPVPWLLQTANRTCFDMIGKRKRLCNSDEIDFDKTTKMETLTRQESQSMLINILEKFDMKTRDIVLLYYLEEMTMEEIAYHCGFSRKTVGRKINRFIRDVTELLEKDRKTKVSS